MIFKSRRPKCKTWKKEYESGNLASLEEAIKNLKKERLNIEVSDKCAKAFVGAFGAFIKYENALARGDKNKAEYNLMIAKSLWLTYCDLLERDKKWR